MAASLLCGVRRAETEASHSQDHGRITKQERPNDSTRIEWQAEEWRYIACDDGVIRADDWRDRLEGLRVAIANPKAILKQDHRSKVSVIDYDSRLYVVKEFILQQTWWWFKFTSLAFPTLGEIALANSEQLIREGFATPKPAILMQRRTKGMVIESLLVYPYLPGKEVTTDDAEAITEYVHKMHEADWIHRDPHPANFLKTEEGLAIIDPIRAKKTRSRYLKAYDVMLMEHDMPEAPDLYGRQALGLYFALAKQGHDFIRSYRRMKKSIRSSLGLGRSGNLLKGTGDKANG